jgi:hypothetical protein
VLSIHHLRFDLVRATQDSDQRSECFTVHTYMSGLHRCCCLRYRTLFMQTIHVSRHEAAVGTEANPKGRFFAVDLHVNPFWVGRPFYMSTLCLKSLRLGGPCLRRPFSNVSRAYSPGSVLLSSLPPPRTGKDRIAHAAGTFSTPRIRNQILVRTGSACA